VTTPRPFDLILTGSSREQRERRVAAGREAGLWLLLLVPAGSLTLAALLLVALALVTVSPAPEPAGADVAAGAPFEIWAASPLIEETPGDLATTDRQPGASRRRR
jgi:hypothetical protein